MQHNPHLGAMVGIPVAIFILLGVVLAWVVQWKRRQRRQRKRETIDPTPYMLHSNNEEAGPLPDPLVLKADVSPNTRSKVTEPLEQGVERSNSWTGSTDSRAEVVALRLAMRRAGFSVHALIQSLRPTGADRVDMPPHYDG
ncbi:hypothetical protein EXIGLDRAFT_1548 [Exidia glandulosa HHB12029]|uniref:Uncharacterized protein n=1 Tax=Exidia glandulosa HHB12029 TaxID=1314781 RepID=A0A165QK19_EXIGL|nr:hypothetical protein EXIGLDRAFT_1548 [Exidia glandulosa HHB12029]